MLAVDQLDHLHHPHTQPVTKSQSCGGRAARTWVMFGGMDVELAGDICILKYFGTAACIVKSVTEGWFVTTVALIAVIAGLFGALAKSIRIWIPLPAHHRNQRSATAGKSCLCILPVCKLACVQSGRGLGGWGTDLGRR